MSIGVFSNFAPISAAPVSHIPAMKSSPNNDDKSQSDKKRRLLIQ